MEKNQEPLNTILSLSTYKPRIADIHYLQIQVIKFFFLFSHSLLF